MTIDEMRAGLAELFTRHKKVQDEFSREKYPYTFSDRYDEAKEFLSALHEEYVKAENKNELTAQLADVPVAAAKEALAQIKAKNKREMKQIDFNLTMVAFLEPVILMYPSEYFEELVEAMAEAWGKAFPKFKIKKAEYALIATGFRKRYCYITTAVCMNKGLGDDCHELALLRDYRDNRLALNEEGRELIRDYYNIAPTIVSRIDMDPEKNNIYEHLYRSYISPCISYLESGNEDKCHDRYVEMVLELKKNYLFTGKGEEEYERI